jgi:ABC-type thiamine transport system ATPase subunit
MLVSGGHRQLIALAFLKDVPVIPLNKPISPLSSDSAAAAPLTFVTLAPLATV